MHTHKLVLINAFANDAPMGVVATGDRESLVRYANRKIKKREPVIFVTGTYHLGPMWQLKVVAR
jgi:hypothetical protein